MDTLVPVNIDDIAVEMLSTRSGACKNVLTA